MCLNHPWLKFFKKARSFFFLNRSIICLNQVDHVFKPGLESEPPKFTTFDLLGSAPIRKCLTD